MVYNYVMPILFTSNIDISKRDAVEALLFFNDMQGTHRRGIERSIERFGMPSLYEDNGALRVSLGARECQAIYAIDGAVIAGVIVFIIDSEEDSIFIAHIAVADDYNHRGIHARMSLATRLVSEVMGIAVRLNKKYIRLFYSGADEPIRIRCGVSAETAG